MSDESEDAAGIPLIEALSDSDSASNPVSGKRKRQNGSEAAVKKSAKRRKLKKPVDVQDAALDGELGVNHAIAHMDSALMADHIAKRTKRFQPELSLVEFDDSNVPERAILDTTSWQKPRTNDQLADFLEKFAAPKRKKKKGPKLEDAPEEKGNPHTLIIASAGLRAADLTRAVRKFQNKGATVAKLFAKHIKLKEAVEVVKKSRITIGVGTPQRVIDLLDNGALSSARLERIVIDASHIDQKKRGIMDMKETHVPLVQLLTRTELRERYATGENRVELLFF